MFGGKLGNYKVDCQPVLRKSKLFKLSSVLQSTRLNFDRNKKKTLLADRTCGYGLI